MPEPTIADVLARIDRLSETTLARFDALNLRVDGLHTRIDTLIDTIAAFRRDFDQHTHE